MASFEKVSRSLGDIGKTIIFLNPFVLIVFLSVHLNKLPWSDSSSQASNDGREDSKDKDMRPSDGRKTNGSHEPPPQYADMAGQVPTSPGVSHHEFFNQKTFLQRCFFFEQKTITDWA